MEIQKRMTYLVELTIKQKELIKALEEKIEFYEPKCDACKRAEGADENHIYTCKVTECFNNL